jgi:hypothetical protein
VNRQAKKARDRIYDRAHLRLSAVRIQIKFKCMSSHHGGFDGRGRNIFIFLPLKLLLTNKVMFIDIGICH